MNGEEVTYYQNKDISGKSQAEFSGMFNAPIPDGSDFIANMEWALMYLDMNKSGTPFGYDESRAHFFNISTFDGAYLFNVNKLGATEENDVKFLDPFSEDFKFSMFSDWNIKTMQFSSGENAMPIQLQKVRLLSDKERFALPDGKLLPVIEHSNAFLSKSEKWFTLRNGYQLQKRKSKTASGLDVSLYVPIPFSLDKRFYIAKHHIAEFLKSDDCIDILQSINMLISARMTMYYEWFVYIRETPKSVGFKIPIVPESSKDVFSMRDIPEGKERRSAICNFVRQHYRSIKTDYDPGQREVIVKKHLRGETKFNWRGLDVNIVPSEYDINRIRPRKKFLNV